MELIRFIVLRPSADIKAVFYREICYSKPCGKPSGKPCGKLCGKPLMVYHLHIIILLMCLSYVANIVIITCICYMYRIEAPGGGGPS